MRTVLRVSTVVLLLAMAGLASPKKHDDVFTE